MGIKKIKKNKLRFIDPVKITGLVKKIKKKLNIKMLFVLFFSVEEKETVFTMKY